MQVAAVIPVGPGHQAVADEAIDSVVAAARAAPFLAVEPIVVPDELGEMGRSKARNLGARVANADWIFWLDADDLALPDAFALFSRELAQNPAIEACWGSMHREIVVVDQRGRQQRQIVRQPDGLARTDDHRRAFGFSHWLNVGHFIRGDLHRRVGGWCERLDLAEDFEYFAACLHHAEQFIKITEPLAHIRAHYRSAVGPRGYELSTFNDGVYEAAKARGDVIRAYWNERGRKPWTAKERRSRPAIYGDIGPLLEGEG